MGQIDIRINGQPYQLACDDGQEEQLLKLAALIDARVVELAGSVGQVGEARLILMAALLIADELNELRQTAESASKDNKGEDNQAELANLFENLADRLEALASGLEDTWTTR